MNLIFLNQYYPPDVAPTGVMLEAVAEELARQGHAVTVICAEGKGYAGGSVGGGRLAVGSGREDVGGGRLAIGGGGEEEFLQEGTEEMEGGEVGGGRLAVGSGVEEVGSGEEEEVLQEGTEGEEVGGRRLAVGGGREDVGGGRLAVGGEEGEILKPGTDKGTVGGGRSAAEALDPTANRQQTTANLPHPAANSQPPTANPPPPRVVRIAASRFGRGTFLGKLVDYLSYYLGVIWKLLWLHPRPDRVVALTTPPYLSVVTRGLSRLRGGDHAHWVMDLYPDVMVAHGMLGDGGIAHRALRGLARWGFGGGRCAAVLTLGPDMARRTSELGGPGPMRECGSADRGHARVSWVPLWETAAGGGASAGDDAGLALRRARGWRDEELVVMYSGNMGLGHRFGEILEACGQTSTSEKERNREDAEGASNIEHRTANVERGEEEGTSNIERPTSNIEEGVGSLEALSRTARRSGSDLVEEGTSNGERKMNPVRWVFFGAGKRRPEIARFMADHPELPVELHGYAPADILAEHLRSADVHLASLEPAWTGTMVPSKLQGIFAAGRPVIFIGDGRSSIGRWVVESGGGWLVAPGDPGALRRAIDAARDPAERHRRGQAAAAFARRHFDKATNVRRVAEVLTGGR